MTNTRDSEMVPDGDPRLTAYALGELDAPENAAERAEVEALLRRDPAARAEVEAVRAVAAELGEAFAAESAAESVPALTLAQRAAIESAAGAGAPRIVRRHAAMTWLWPLSAAATLLLWALWYSHSSEPEAQKANDLVVKDEAQSPTPVTLHGDDAKGYLHTDGEAAASRAERPAVAESVQSAAVPPVSAPTDSADSLLAAAEPPSPVAPAATAESPAGTSVARSQSALDESVVDQLGALGYPAATGSSSSMLTAQGRKAKAEATTGALPETVPFASELAAMAYLSDGEGDADDSAGEITGRGRREAEEGRVTCRYLRVPPTAGESYQPIVEQGFQSPWTAPFSTFGVDVDTASYSNVRRFLNNGQLPPRDAVRIEELVNYFRYDDPGPQPGAECPFGVTVDVTDCPWAPGRKLARIALKGREVPAAERGQTNLVFLLDVSGSMDEPDKLPLLVQSMKALVQQLDERDRVAIVTYAGAAGLVLDSTSCDGPGRERVLEALDRLRAGGSTAGAAGIQLAYQVATRSFRDGGTNRVLLATDGDFNVGVTDRTQLQSLIEQSAKTGVFLTVLGFGEGNLKDGTAELLADKGNGQYCYIDSLDEGRRVLVQQMGGTLVTIAKDVKLQVEFNPAQVEAYRLVGYENRALAPQDFKDDRKDAGDIGAGHSVVALYELVPPGGASLGVDAPRYQKAADAPKPELVPSDELLTVKLRWKQPDGATSTESILPVRDGGRPLAEARADVQFSAAVAAYGLLLRDSAQITADRNWLWEQLIRMADAARGKDPDGWRGEFVRLAKTARGLKVQASDVLDSIGYTGKPDPDR